MGPKNRGAVERRWAARRTPVSDIFRGKTRVRLHRAAHHDVTDAVQPFFTLQLDIEVRTLKPLCQYYRVHTPNSMGRRQLNNPLDDCLHINADTTRRAVMQLFDFAESFTIV